MARTTRWALLCGGDYYLKGTKRDTDQQIRYPHLHGCVRDVLAIETFLQSIGVDERNIRKLTASHRKPLEDEAVWPTHKNIFRELKRIENDAKRGDLVYIHYSGHGIRRDQLQPKDEGGDPLMGTALVMTDVLTGGAYLTGYQMGVRVRKMVEEKGLRVTLVLDSCFSGGGFRHHEGPGVRTVVGQHDGSMLSSDKEADKYADDSNSDFNFRNATVTRRCWLSNPTGCTVLTACGVNEFASERLLEESKFKRGVLTHWMLDILQKPSNPLPSHASVKDHVVEKVKRMVPALKQSPMVYGEGSYEFFGSKLLNIERAVRHVQKGLGKTIDLDIGSAQGAALRAIYDVYPHNWDFEGEKGLRPPSEARVTKVSTFESTAVLTGDANVGTGTDCRAILRQWALPDNVFVVLAFHDWEKLKPELEKTPGMYLKHPNWENWSFLVMVDEQNFFEVLQKGVFDGFNTPPRVPRFPRISIDDSCGFTKLAYALSHLARYHCLANVRHHTWPDGLTSDDIVFEFDRGFDPEGYDYGAVPVVENGSLELTFAYKGRLEQVWLSIFTFNASWGIEKIEPDPKSGQVARAMPRNASPEKLELSFEIPEKSRDDDPSDIIDTVMAFVCDGDDPPSWDEICLPSLPIDGSIPELLRRVEPSLADYRNSKVKRSTSIERRWTILKREVYIRPN